MLGVEPVAWRRELGASLGLRAIPPDALTIVAEQPDGLALAVEAVVAPMSSGVCCLCWPARARR